jgi:hypothetical protein
MVSEGRGPVTVAVDPAELDLAAWARSGGKLWTTFVEPPWSYQVVGEHVRLDVMGRKSAFPVGSGPGG